MTVDEIKRILEKQLQLLSEKSTEHIAIEELPNISRAMVEIAGTLISISCVLS